MMTRAVVNPRKIDPELKTVLQSFVPGVDLTKKASVVINFNLRMSLPNLTKILLLKDHARLMFSEKEIDSEIRRLSAVIKRLQELKKRGSDE